MIADGALIRSGVTHYKNPGSSQAGMTKLALGVIEY